jgi:small conductance mechanosensitive channel
VAEAIARDVKAALDKANVLKQTTAAVQQQLDNFRQRVGADRAGAIATGENQSGWRVDNPFTPQRLLQWGVDHGPRLLTILIAALLLYLLVKLSGRHLAKIVAHGASRGTLHERENRAITLVGVFQNVATIAVLVGGCLMLLDEVGIPILPLMGGAAVLGLAVAFGSQNLIKDYFSGFMLLMEDQYGVNDVIKIGEISGAVEQITLRITVLRDLEGVVHFVPHGTITTVSNMTHGWSRALLDIAVAYKEDTDRVMAVMLEVAQELRGDEQFGPLILEDAEMLGVDLLGDSSVSVKMVIKTHPLKRWAVRREYLRRIKQRFDQVGIEIPFPYRNVLVRQIDGAKHSDVEAA